MYKVELVGCDNFFEKNEEAYDNIVILSTDFNYEEIGIENDWFLNAYELITAAENYIDDGQYSRGSGFDRNDPDCWEVDEFAEAYEITKRAAKRILELCAEGYFEDMSKAHTNTGKYWTELLKIIYPKTDYKWSNVSDGGYANRSLSLIYNESAIEDLGINVDIISAAYYGSLFEIVCTDLETGEYFEPVITGCTYISHAELYSILRDGIPYFLEELRYRFCLNDLNEDNTCILKETDGIFSYIECIFNEHLLQDT